jgi:hypothetical protein
VQYRRPCCIATGRLYVDIYIRATSGNPGFTSDTVCHTVCHIYVTQYVTQCVISMSHSMSHSVSHLCHIYVTQYVTSVLLLPPVLQGPLLGGSGGCCRAVDGRQGVTA